MEVRGQRDGREGERGRREGIFQGRQENGAETDRYIRERNFFSNPSSNYSGHESENEGGRGGGRDEEGGGTGDSGGGRGGAGIHFQHETQRSYTNGGGGRGGGGGGGGGGWGGYEYKDREEEERERRPLNQSTTTDNQKENPGNLRIVYLNARSIVNKLNDLSILINDHDPDLILISETWCNEDISNALLNIPGYIIEPELRKDRNDTMNGIGGGVLVYVRNDLIIKPINVENEFNMFVQFEVINSQNKDDKGLTITLLYRPPRSREQNTLELCKLINNAPENSIFIGDFNFPAINWLTFESDRFSEPFLQCVNENNFEQLVEFPTHVRGNILDLVLSNRPDIITNVESLGNLSTSDHSIICVDVNFRSKFNSSSELIIDWKNGDVNGLKNYLGSVNWIAELRDKDTEDSWTFIKEKINTGINTFIPKIPRRRGNNHQWMTKGVKKLVRQKQRHYNLYMNTRSDEHYVQFKKTEKMCKKAIRSAKRKFEQKIAKNGNKRPFNSYIKSKTSSRLNIGPLKSGNNLITDNLEMATVLNQQFSSVFSHEDTTNLPPYPQLNGQNTVEDVYFDEMTVKSKIKNLKISSSSGPDGISSKFLYDHVDYLSVPLSILYTKSLASGSVPQDWREANVSPIYKKGSKNNPENYRPISLTSIPCKIMESILKDGIINYLLNYHLLNSSQHGFLPNKSCTTNLLVFLEKITKAVDEGIPMDIIYLDFSKAFDKVPHKRLLLKMKSLGITGNILKWVESWLTNRKQRTVLNGVFSSWVDVESGVPQGSVLGPLLFVIFINDIDSCADEIDILLKFADDTKLGHKARNIEDCLKTQKCLDKLIDWANTWNMSFNISKCKVLHVGRNNLNHVYTMNGTPLEVTTVERDIGVQISSNLKPFTQCAEAARRAGAILTQISKAFLYRDSRIFIQLYKQFVRCHLEFAVPAWSPWLLGDIDILEKVQRRAVNMVVGLKGQNYEDKLVELGLRSLEDRRKRIDLVQTFKIVHGIDKIHSSLLFTLVGEQNLRLTRNTAYSKNMVEQRSRTDIRKHFFCNRIVSLWNSLPSDLKDSRNLNVFKTALEKLII